MKKVICLLVASVLLLCGCVQTTQTEHPKHSDLEKFSYLQESAEYHDGRPGVRSSGFVNTESVEINNTDQVTELAKKECSGVYNTVTVAFDPDQKIYRVLFSLGDTYAGGGVSVYINENGITQLVVAYE